MLGNDCIQTWSAFNVVWIPPFIVSFGLCLVRVLASTCAGENLPEEWSRAQIFTWYAALNRCPKNSINVNIDSVIRLSHGREHDGSEKNCRGCVWQSGKRTVMIAGYRWFRTALKFRAIPSIHRDRFVNFAVVENERTRKDKRSEKMQLITWWACEEN